MADYDVTVGAAHRGQSFSIPTDSLVLGIAVQEGSANRISMRITAPGGITVDLPLDTRNSADAARNRERVINLVSHDEVRLELRHNSTTFGTGAQVTLVEIPDYYQDTYMSAGKTTIRPSGDEKWQILECISTHSSRQVRINRNGTTEDVEEKEVVGMTLTNSIYLERISGNVIASYRVVD